MITGQTDKGLRYAVRQAGTAVGYCALSIRCGTRDEGEFPQGIAHFTEHTIFRGTRKRSAAAIASGLDRLGGELNAYTTKEEIVIHATVLKEDLPKAIGLLLELATEASFPEREVETERGVVIDEIISYKDSPSEDVYDRFEEALFAGHPLCRPILGTAASVRKITPADLHRFRAAFFRPERMALTVVSPLEEPRMEKDVKRLTEKYFPAFGTGNATPEAGNGESKAPAAPPFDRTVNKRNHEVNAVIGGRAPSLYEPKDRITAVLLTNILGGPASNSLLNSALREKKGWVYGIECSYTQYAETGVVAITFGCDRPNLETCMATIEKILTRLRETPLSEARVKSYRKQLLGQLAIGSEAGEAQCLSMGKSMLAWGEILSPEQTRAKIEAISPEDLQKMAERLFAQENLSSLIYL